MNNLLSANFYKLYKSKEFWALLILFPTITILTTVTKIFSFVEITSGTNMLMYGLNSWFVITLASIIISNFVAEDFFNGAMFYRVAKGYRKSLIYLSYFITCSIIMFVFISFEGITGFLIGAVTNNIGSFSGALLINVMFSLLFSVAYTSLFIMIAFLSRKSFQAMTIAAIVSIALSALLPYSCEILHIDYISKIWVSGYTDKVSSTNDIVLALIVAVFYIVAFYLIGYFNFKKRDIE